MDGATADGLCGTVHSSQRTSRFMRLSGHMQKQHVSHASACKWPAVLTEATARKARLCCDFGLGATKYDLHIHDRISQFRWRPSPGHSENAWLAMTKFLPRGAT